MSQQNHNHNAYVNVNSSFRTVLPDNPTSNGASELNAVYDSLPYTKRHKGMPLADNQTANTFVQNYPVPNLCAINSAHRSHASMRAITGPDLVHNNSNESNMIVRTLSNVGKRSCIKSCIKKVLFRRLKFCDRIQHGGYDLQFNSVCSICRELLCYCHIIECYCTIWTVRIIQR
jgi:hypothetical protein